MGILFRMVFVIFKNISTVISNNKLSELMTISGYTIIMITISLASAAYVAAYPLFGIISSSFVCIASFMINFGLYFSAIYVSEDIELRKIIRKSGNELKIVDNIDTAQKTNEVEKI